MSGAGASAGMGIGMACSLVFLTALAPAEVRAQPAEEPSLPTEASTDAPPGDDAQGAAEAAAEGENTSQAASELRVPTAGPAPASKRVRRFRRNQGGRRGRRAAREGRIVRRARRTVWPETMPAPELEGPPMNPPTGGGKRPQRRDRFGRPLSPAPQNANRPMLKEDDGRLGRLRRRKVRAGSYLAGDGGVVSALEDVRGALQRRRDQELESHYGRMAELDVMLLWAERNHAAALKKRIARVRRKERSRFRMAMARISRMARRRAAVGLP